MHTFICSVSISMDISKMNKFIENLAKLFNKTTSFSCHKKNNAIVPDNPNPQEHLLTVRILIFEEEVHFQSNIEHEQATRVKEMEDEQRNFSQIMDCPCPTILFEIQMPLGQSSGQE